MCAQSVPRLSFPGGALVGCTAGLLNVAKLKGTHNAVRSGIMCAESIVDTLKTHKSSSRK
jgi:electron-transferring-flavoprotein dehydrogenase